MIVRVCGWVGMGVSEALKHEKLGKLTWIHFVRFTYTQKLNSCTRLCEKHSALACYVADECRWSSFACTKYLCSCCSISKEPKDARKMPYVRYFFFVAIKKHFCEIWVFFFLISARTSNAGNIENTHILLLAVHIRIGVMMLFTLYTRNIKFLFIWFYFVNFLFYFFFFFMHSRLNCWFL